MGSERPGGVALLPLNSGLLVCLELRGHTQMAEPGLVTLAPEMSSCCLAAVNSTCQSLSLGLNPTAPAPAPLPSAHPTN